MRIFAHFRGMDSELEFVEPHYAHPKVLWRCDDNLYGLVVSSEDNPYKTFASI